MSDHGPTSRQCQRATTAPNKGLLVVVSGPSGVGKSTLCRRLAELLDARLSISATTRPMRRGEAEGRDYYFLSRGDFEAKVARGEFIEHAEYDGNLYGTPAEPLREAVAAGRVVLLDIDVQGGRQVRRLFPDAVMVFVLPPSPDDLAARLGGRNTDSPEAQQRRLERARQEISFARESGVYRYFVVNDAIERAVEEIAAIVQKERRLP